VPNTSPVGVFHREVALGMILTQHCLSRLRVISSVTRPQRHLQIPSASHQVVAHEVTRRPAMPMIGSIDLARSDSKGPSLQPDG